MASHLLSTICAPKVFLVLYVKLQIMFGTRHKNSLNWGDTHLLWSWMQTENIACKACGCPGLYPTHLSPLQKHILTSHSAGSNILWEEANNHKSLNVFNSVADPETLEMGPRNMNLSHHAWRPSFYDYFLQARGGMAPLPPPGSAPDGWGIPMQIRQNPLWLWNPEETSPEIQNRGTSGPKIGHVKVSDKKNF